MKGNKKGFTLVESMIGVVVFVLFSMGIYGGILSATKLGIKSRTEILENAILIEQMESIRNLSFQDIGIIGGNPAGVLTTSTVLTRSGTEFFVNRAVRSVDDPADGLAPLDSDPDDYRAVSLHIQCVNCTTPTESYLSSNIRPEETNALNVRAVDSNGNPVPGATVTINNLQLSSTTIGTTDSNGYFSLANIATGTLVYDISVSKPGYSTDSTFYPSATNTSPVKLPVTIQHGSSVNITFAIDKLSSLNVSAFDESCNPIGGANFRLIGGKLIGFPNIFKYSRDQFLGAINNLEWDNYTVSVSGTSYDLAGANPGLPVSLAPGSDQNLILNLTSQSGNSLLVNVVDATNNMPVGGATVKLWKMLIPTTTLNTTGGYVGQTDWSGGSGQQTFSDPTKFASGGGNFNINNPIGDLSLQPGQLSGSLDSSTFDLGSDAYTLRNIFISPIPQPSESQVLAQIAASTSPSGVTNFVGPDGTASTYYTPTNTTIWSGGEPYRYLRYKVYLNTSNSNYKPNVSDINLTYSGDCHAPGNAFFGSLLQRSYLLEVSRPGYSTSIACVDVAGPSSITVSLQSPGGTATTPTCITPNSAPTVVATAAANPSPVNGTTTTLSVSGNDNDGESNLIYTWSVISKPIGASDPTFSQNGNNSAKSTVTTFYKAGDYTFSVTIRDADYQTVTSNVSVTVNQVATTVTLNPSSVTLLPNQTRQFSASTVDQFGAGMGTSFTWSVASGIGSIDSSGLYTAPGSSGNATVRATVPGGVYGSASVVVDAPPYIVTGASASPSTVTGTNTSLSVTANDDGGESNLIYTWSTLTKPGASNPTFSPNGSNSAKNTTVTFPQAGSYSFRVTVRDALSQTVTSDVSSVVVNQSVASVSVSPDSRNITTASGNQPFTASAVDQFGAPMSGSFSWSVDGGGAGGSINSSGVYSPAGVVSTIGGTATVRATLSGHSGTATVTYICGSTLYYSISAYSDSVPTVQIGSQCWTRRGVKIGSMLTSVTSMPTLEGGIPEMWCYNNDPSLCNTNGGLYTWYEANQPNLAGCDYYNYSYGWCSVPNPNQGICPPGWHIPTVNDFNTLRDSLGMTSYTINPSTGLKCYSPSTLGAYFTNYTGGYRWSLYSGGSYQSYGSGSLMWTRDIISGGAYFETIYDNINCEDYADGGDGSPSNYFYNTDGYSVRCIKN